MLPETVDKVLYVDGDTLFIGSISNLENYVFKEELICGVYDFSLSDYRVKRNISFRQDDIYINAGVMLINLKAWRMKGVSQKCKELLLSSSKYLLGDQDVINIVCKDKIGLLPMNYNMTGISAVLPYYFNRLVMDDYTFYYYSQKQMKVAQMNPIIIHYATEIFGKPWQKQSHSVYENKWIEYRKKITIENINYDNRYYSSKKIITIYKKVVECIILPFYKHKLWGIVAILYYLFYKIPHKIQFWVWRLKCL